MGSGYASMIGSIMSAKRTGHWGIRPLKDSENLLGGDTADPCSVVPVTDAGQLGGILDGMAGRTALLWSPVKDDSCGRTILGSEDSRPQVVAVMDLRRAPEGTSF